MEPTLSIIDCMHRTRNRLLGWGGSLLLAGFVGLIFIWFWSNIPQNVFLSIVAFGAFIIIAGMYLLVLAGTILHPAKHPVVTHLKRERHQIVWVYSFINVNMPFGVHLFRLVTIWLHYRDGSQQHVRIEHKYLSTFMQQLENKLPHATFGYSVKNEQLYRANPELLERE